MDENDQRRLTAMKETHVKFVESVEIKSPVEKKQTPVIFDRDNNKGFESDNIE